MIEISGYRIVRTLGQGGMATVYLAIQESFEREVALKILSDELAKDTTFSERFVREARIVSRLVHPNIVTVYDVGIENGHHFLSMEYIPGEDLKDARHKLGLAERLSVVKDIARALTFSGKKGYVHRDVKPENIMLHADGERAVLMDFGIARPSESVSNMTQTGTAIGTPHYMSPEQARGQTVDPRSDLYSLGVVLFLMLTGRVPFDADSAVAVGVKHVSEPIPRLPAYLLPFQGIANKVLSKDPAHRYQSGDELVADLEAITPETLAEIERFEASQMHLAEDVEAADIEAETLISQPLVEPSASPVSLVASVTQLSQEVDISATAADRIEQGPHEKASLWPWVSALMLAGGVAFGVYYQQHLPADYRLLAPAPQNVGEPTVSPVDTELGSAGAARPLPGSDAAADLSSAPSRENLATELPEKTGAALLADERLEAASLAERPAASLKQSGASTTAVLAATAATNLDVQPETQGLPPDSMEENRGSLARVESAVASSPEVATTGRDAASPATFAQNREGRLAYAADLQARAAADLKAGLTLMPMAADTYRQLLGRDPSDQQAREGLRAMRELMQREARAALGAENFLEVERLLKLASATFPRAENEPRFKRLQQRMESTLAVKGLFEQARTRIQSNALTTPAGESAVDALRAVLALEPNHPVATKGMTDIARRLEVMAAKQLAAGNLARASTLVERGLSVNAKQPKLLKMARLIERQRQAQKILSRAQQREAQGQALEPKKTSALALYRQVLKQQQQPQQQDAQAALERLEDGLVAAVESRISSNDYKGATAEVNRALDFFPSSQTLRNLQRINEQAIGDMIEASRPKISKVLVSSQAMDSLLARQQDSLAVDRIIHVGFYFQNFAAATSVVQAVLFDGARRLQIAQVPVIVSGQEGAQFFRIERPVEGFADGGYSIDLLLEGKSLSSAVFEVGGSADL